MPNLQLAICPCCHKSATKQGRTDEIEAKFGWRYPNNPRPQAYCRACRNNGCSSHRKQCQGRIGR